LDGSFTSVGFLVREIGLHKNSAPPTSSFFSSKFKSISFSFGQNEIRETYSFSIGQAAFIQRDIGYISFSFDDIPSIKIVLSSSSWGIKTILFPRFVHSFSFFSNTKSSS